MGGIRKFFDYFFAKRMTGYSKSGHFERGFIEYFLLQELHALGVNLNEVEVGTDPKGRAALRFNLPGEVRQRTIVFVTYDIENPDPSVSGELEGKLDAVLQKGVSDIVSSGKYPDHLRRASSWIKPDGFLVTSDYDSEGKYVPPPPVLDQNFRAQRIPALSKLAYNVFSFNWWLGKGGYGWKMTIRRKLLSPKPQGQASEENIVAEILERAGLGDVLQYEIAPAALLPFLRLRAQMHGLSLEDYAYYIFHWKSSLYAAMELGLSELGILRGHVRDALSQPVFGGRWHRRDYESWAPPLQRFLLDTLIPLKVRNNDFSICAKSLGAATGHEPYGIEIEIYKALFSYAQQEVFGHVEEQEQKNTLAWQWVKERWKVRVEAYEKGLISLEIASEGRYRLDDHQSIQDMMMLKGLFAIAPREIKMGQILRDGLVATFMDFEDPQMYPILVETKADIVFCRNLLMHMAAGQNLLMDTILHSDWAGLTSDVNANFFFTDVEYAYSSRETWQYAPEGFLRQFLLENNNDMAAVSRRTGVPEGDLWLSRVRHLLRKISPGIRPEAGILDGARKIRAHLEEIGRSNARGAHPGQAGLEFDVYKALLMLDAILYPGSKPRHPDTVFRQAMMDQAA